MVVDITAAPKSSDLPFPPAPPTPTTTILGANSAKCPGVPLGTSFGLILCIGAFGSSSADGAADARSGAGAAALGAAR